MRGGALVLAALVAAPTACGEIAAPRKPGVAPAAAPGASVELVPGVIMDRSGHTLFAATSGGQLVAIDVASGTERWTSMEAQRPLLLTPLGVLAQRDSEGVTERLDLVLIDARSGALARGCEPVRTAAWVKALLAPAPDQEFRVRARASVEGRPVVEWWARATRPVEGAAAVVSDAGVPVLPEASGWGLIDPLTCGVLELGALGPDAAPWERPALGPVTVDGITAELIVAPGVTGQVAALRRRRGDEPLPDVPLAADLDVRAAPLWSADGAWASVTSPEPGRPGAWQRWIVAGVADGTPLATILVRERPRGFAVTPRSIVVVLRDEIEAFDRDGKTLWVRAIRSAGEASASPALPPSPAP